jgi:hypothetical protein
MHFAGDQLIAMDGRSLLNLKYEEAMDLFRSGGAEVEILLSQVSTDIGIFMREEELCDTEASRNLKHSDQPDSGKLCIPLTNRFFFSPLYLLLHLQLLFCGVFHFCNTSVIIHCNF